MDDLRLVNTGRKCVGTLKTLGRKSPCAHFTFLPNPPLSCRRILLELCRHAPIHGNIKEFPQDLEPLIGLCRHERLELTLWQQHDLPELFSTVAEELDYSLFDWTGLLFRNDLAGVRVGYVLE
ncbi:hypothetical protein AJ87_40530 [Rhizobium yanglingense]|nr:hypothetical protein AJ87_40530 [Rhizobium yanglingense]